MFNIYQVLDYNKVYRSYFLLQNILYLIKREKVLDSDYKRIIFRENLCHYMGKPNAAINNNLDGK